MFGKLIEKIKYIKFIKNKSKSKNYYKGNECEIHYYDNEYYIILNNPKKVYNSNDFDRFEFFMRFLKNEKYFTTFILIYNRCFMYGTIRSKIRYAFDSPFKYVLEHSFYIPSAKFKQLSEKWDKIYYSFHKEISNHNSKVCKFKKKK